MWAIDALSSHKKFTEWTKHYAKAIEDEQFDEAIRKSNMDKINPRYVLRNWIAQDVITKTERNNFDLLHKVHKIVQQPFLEQEEAELLGFADPPPDWAKNISQLFIVIIFFWQLLLLHYNSCLVLKYGNSPYHIFICGV